MPDLSTNNFLNRRGKRVNLIQKHLLVFSVSGILLLSLGGTASAQFIAWQESVNLFMGETTQDFVDTTGELAVALNATNPQSITANALNINAFVNGVFFVGVDLNQTLVGSSGEGIAINTGGSGGNTFVSFGDGEFNADGEIFNLLRGGHFSVSSVTLIGLEIGQEYLIQVFTNDARPSRTELFLVGFGDGSGSASPVGVSALNNSLATGDPANASLGQTNAGDSIIGTFTAASETLTFNVFGSSFGPFVFFPGSIRNEAQVNAIQLRRLATLVGDFDFDLDVDVDDLDRYSRVIGAAAVGVFSNLDLDGDGVVGENDFIFHYEELVMTSNGQVGTFAGDFNLDGEISVLGDAFVMIGNLGLPVTSWSQGDANADGFVDVLGDAFILIGNLGLSNGL